MTRDTRRIDDHGVIGDLRTCALIANDGTLDYLCWPELDSPSLFTALLDSDASGCFSLAPTWEAPRRLQLYLPDTNILQTRWLSEQGVAELTDYMPICHTESEYPCIVRRLTMVQGEATFTLRCNPVHDYARADTQANAQHGRVVFSAEGQPNLVLVGSEVLTLDTQAAHARFTLKAGQHAEFRLGAPDD